MQSLWDMPALEAYPHRVPARTYNAWRRYALRHGPAVRVELRDVPPMAVEVEGDKWVCVDVSLNDAPVIAWSEFLSSDRTLVDPVPCVVTHFHFGASAIRDRVLADLAIELEARITRPSNIHDRRT